MMGNSLVFQALNCLKTICVSHVGRVFPPRRLVPIPIVHQVCHLLCDDKCISLSSFRYISLGGISSGLFSPQLPKNYIRNLDW